MQNFQNLRNHPKNFKIKIYSRFSKSYKIIIFYIFEIYANLCVVLNIWTKRPTKKLGNYKQKL